MICLVCFIIGLCNQILANLDWIETILNFFFLFDNLSGLFFPNMLRIRSFLCSPQCLWCVFKMLHKPGLNALCWSFARQTKSLVMKVWFLSLNVTAILYTKTLLYGKLTIFDLLANNAF